MLGAHACMFKTIRKRKKVDFLILMTPYEIGQGVKTRRLYLGILKSDRNSATRAPQVDIVDPLLYSIGQDHGCQASSYVRPEVSRQK